MDPRFAKLHTDPRFVRPKADKTKLVVDKRFSQFFDDDGSSGSKGKKANKVDKYGRPLEKQSTQNELKRYYRLDGAAETPAAPAAEKEDAGDDDVSEDEVEEKTFVDLARGEGGVESSDEEGAPTAAGQVESDSDSDSDGPVTLASASVRRRRRPSPSRSPSIDLSETEAVFPASDAGSDDEEEEDEDVEATTRLAVVNMDWDHLRATDLYRVLASSLSLTALPLPAPPKPTKNKKFDSKGEEIGPYKPPSRLTLATGRLLHLRIYPSSFGAARMEKEAVEGPPMEVFLNNGDASGSEGEEVKMGRKKKSHRKKREDSEEIEVTARDVIQDQLEDGADNYDGEALRRYQLERLRYYYAVATFDTPAAASHVFSEINGTEFERTANVFDLQYVPESTSFESDVVHDEATEASVAAAGASYQGIDFVTDALRHSKVTLTWDADDPHRKSKIDTYLSRALEGNVKGKKATKNLNDDDVRAYLASSSDEGGSEDEVAEDEFFATEGPKVGKREKLRGLFGLDKSGSRAGGEDEWDGGKVGRGGKDGEMQITFAPALTDAKNGASDEDDDREETALETYKRKDKERRERKRLERKAKREGVTLPAEGEEGPEFGGEDVGPGGFDDDFFKEDADEAFAAFDAGEDLESGDEIGEKRKKKEGKLSKREKREKKEQQEVDDREAQAELALLVASDSDDDPSRVGRHFDMRSILKAEKNEGKKSRGKGKGKGKRDEEGGKKDEFEIDVGDSRFKSLHEDYDFAIDPSNPKFQKTRNMNTLLAEGRKRRSKAHDPRAPVSAVIVSSKKEVKVDAGADLKKLVESVKRKAADAGGRGKRNKVDEA